MMTEEFRMRAHVNYGQDGSGREFVSTTRPRLAFIDRRSRTKGNLRIWLVDGRDVEGPEAAVAALLIPPELSDSETEMLAKLTDEFQSRRDLVGSSGHIELGTPEKARSDALFWLVRKGLAEAENGQLRKRQQGAS
jgi:hypothetical protein